MRLLANSVSRGFAPGPRRGLTAALAVLSLLATIPLSRAAESARCIETVKRVRTSSGKTIAETVGAREWTYDRRDGHVRAHGGSGDVRMEWSCSDDGVPLVLAVDSAAKALTPERVLE